MYLYLLEKDKFERVPEALAKRFGKAEWVMELDLSKRSTLARADIALVTKALTDQGFYLQLPPRIDRVLHDGD